jgi:hypothetical protein
MDRYSRTHCMASTLTRFESSGFLPVGTPKHPCVCSFCWQWRETSSSHCGLLSDYPQLPRHLSTDSAARDEACRDVYWISWRTFWAHCTLSATTHKLNVSGHTLMWTFFLVPVCGNRAQNSSALFSYTLRAVNYMMENCGLDSFGSGSE